jgi:hypothetical protein
MTAMPGGVRPWRKPRSPGGGGVCQMSGLPGLGVGREVGVNAKRLVAWGGGAGPMM